MKALFKEITIAEPCSQNWDQMQQYQGHNFCQSCQKSVIDFSDYTNEAILQTLANSQTSICGRLSQTQLNQLNYSLIIMPPNRNWMKYLGILAIGTSIFAQDVQAGTGKINTEQWECGKKSLTSPLAPKMIYGYLLDINNKPLDKVKVTISSTNLTAITDVNGRYQIKLDRKLSLKNNLLIAHNANYHGEFELNVIKEKQTNFIVHKSKEMIMGEIMIIPRKLR